MTTPYHRLAGASWWRPVAGTALIVVGLPVVLVGVFGAINAAGEILDKDLTPSTMATSMITLALLTPLVMLAAWLVQRRPPGTLSSVTGRLRWRWLARCLLVAVPIIGVNLLFTGPAEVGGVTRAQLISGLAVTLLLVPFQAAGEEFLFRGWAMQSLGSWIRSPWPGIVVSSVVFGLAHGLGNAWGMADMIMFGLVTAVVTIRTGGLEAAIALHVVNNVATIGLGVVTGTLETQQTVYDVQALTAIVDMTGMVLYGAAVLFLVHRDRGLRRASDSLAPSCPVPV